MPPRKRAVSAVSAPPAVQNQPGMAAAVEETLGALTLTPEDAAAVELARELAAAIDADQRQGQVLADLSSKLLSVLTALNATPQARARVKEGGSTGAGSSRLAVLRAARSS